MSSLAMREIELTSHSQPMASSEKNHHPPSLALAHNTSSTFWQYNDLHTNVDRSDSQLAHWIHIDFPRRFFLTVLHVPSSLHY